MTNANSAERTVEPVPAVPAVVLAPDTMTPSCLRTGVRPRMHVGVAGMRPFDGLG